MESQASARDCLAKLEFLQSMLCEALEHAVAKESCSGNALAAPSEAQTPSSQIPEIAVETEGRESRFEEESSDIQANANRHERGVSKRATPSDKHLLKNERKSARLQEQGISKAIAELDRYQIRDERWSAKARALVCESRYLMDHIEELGMDCNTVHEDIRYLGKLIRDVPSDSEFFGCNLSRKIAKAGWRELQIAYACLAEAVSLIEALEGTEGRRTRHWEDALLEAAKAESLVYKLLQHYAPLVKDGIQLRLNGRIRDMQGVTYVPVWSDSVGVDSLNVSTASIARCLAKLQGAGLIHKRLNVHAHVNLLDVDSVIELHNELVRFFIKEDDPIEPAGPRDKGLLISAISRPTTGLGEYEKYPTTTHKAAALVHSLILNHPFHNGNKRTALAAMVMFLRRNDLILTAEEDDLFSFFLRIAAGDLLDGERDSDREVDVIRQYIQSRVVPIGQPKAMKLAAFIRQCEKAGCKVREKRDGRGWVLRNGKLSLTLQKSIKELDGPVVKAYIGQLNLTEAHSGIPLDTFISEDDLSPEGIIAKYNKLLKRLASY